MPVDIGIEQQRVKTLIAFDNSNIKLLPELSVDIRIITAERNELKPGMKISPVF